MFVKYNQQLKQRYNARDEIDPISLNDIDVCNEWLVGEMDQDDDNDSESNTNRQTKKLVIHYEVF